MSNSRQSVGFHPQDTEPTPFDRYKGKWIIIFPQHGSTFPGYLSKIEGDYLVLNPFQGAEVNNEKGLTRKLVHEDAIVSKHSIIAIEPTTKQNLENSCTYQNNQESGKRSNQD